MRKYEDKPVEEIPFVRYKIVVPTEEDKLKLEEAGYPVKNNIVVNPHVYAQLNGGKATRLH